MKLAIVTGHFTPELGYQEVYLARAYARAGHDVHVFTSTAVSPNARGVVKSDYAAGATRDGRYGFGVTRLAHRLAFGANVLSPGLRSAVLAFDPDIVIIIGLAKLFPGALLCDELRRRCRLVTIFGDAREYADTSSLAGRARTALQRLLFLALKRRLYRRAVRYCDRLVLNHAETAVLFLEYLRPADLPRFNEIALQLTLGFDPDEFHFTQIGRDSTRAELGIGPGEIALITATRVMRSKGLEGVIAQVAAMAESGVAIRYILVGFLDDDYARELKDYIRTLPDPARVICLPFQNHDGILRIYCAGDIGIWTKAAISIQEAMGTGLPIVLEDKPVLRHLLRDGDNGWFFQPGERERRIRAAVSQLAAMPAADRLAARLARTEANRQKLSYDVIAGQIIEGLPIRPGR